MTIKMLEQKRNSKKSFFDSVADSRVMIENTNKEKMNLNKPTHNEILTTSKIAKFTNNNTS